VLLVPAVFVSFRRTHPPKDRSMKRSDDERGSQEDHVGDHADDDHGACMRHRVRGRIAYQVDEAL
jgi:hypothetical protein